MYVINKSSTNGISPLEVVKMYGADATRMHVCFLGGYEDNVVWTLDGINGITSFLNKVWNLKDIIKGEKVSEKHIYEINKLIKKVTDDLENLKLNTAISSLMSFINIIRKDKFITKEELRIFLILLNPLAPFITSEMYEMIFKCDITSDKWPEYDEKYLITDKINLPIQINGKMKKTIVIEKDKYSKEKIIKLIKDEYPNLIKGDIKKVIYIENKIINFIV